MPLIKVKSATDARDKWEKNLSAAVDYIRKGVEATTKEWEENTILAAGTWKDAVTSPGVEKRFAGGVKKVGNKGWQDAMLKLGIDRIRTGVEVNAPKYEEGIKPYLEALSKTELPPRKGRGNIDNLKRVQIITQLLNTLRQKIKGGT